MDDSLDDEGRVEWYRQGRCLNHSTLPAYAWTESKPIRPTRKATQLYRERQAQASSVCILCPVQWQCCAEAVKHGDVWNICAVFPDQRMLLERLARAAGLTVSAVLAMFEAHSMPVVDGIRLMSDAAFRELDPHVVLRSDA